MTQSWPSERIAHLSERVTVGYVGSQAALFTNHGVPLLRGQNVRPFRLHLEDLKFVSRETHEKWRKSSLRAGDVVLVRVGYPGTACVIPEGLGEMNAASLVIVRPARNVLNPSFLASFLNSPEGRRRIRSQLVGSAQQVLNTKAVAAMEIPAPPLHVQDKIAAVLSAYDELIENNNRRIQILEETAQRIYREWFVHFRYPGHEDVPMVESEIGPIPEGWEVSVLGKRTPITLTRTRVPPYPGARLYVATADCAGLHDVGGGEPLSYDRLPSRAQHVPVPESLWVGRMAGYRKILLFPSGSPDIESMVLSSGFFGLEAREGWFAFAAAMVAAETFEAAKSSFATGATQVSLTDRGARSMRFLFPSDETVQQFEAVARPLFELIVSLRRSSTGLMRARDLLLPRLVSGELDVSELDIQVPEAA